MDTTAEDDDVLEIDSPMEVSIDLPSEGEEMHPSKDADEGDETIKIRPARGGQEIEVEIPKHLRRPNEAPREQALDYQESLPYPVETLAEMDERLELIVRNLVDCVEARDYDVWVVHLSDNAALLKAVPSGFVAWNHRLEMWLSLKYPMKRAMRAKLAKLYWELAGKLISWPTCSADLTSEFDSASRRRATPDRAVCAHVYEPDRVRDRLLNVAIAGLTVWPGPRSASTFATCR